MADSVSILRPASSVGLEEAHVHSHNIGLWGFVRVVYSSGDTLSEEATEQTAQQVTDFFRTPLYLEKLMYFGTFLCLDSFLFLFTILPLRIVLATIQWLSHKILRVKGQLSTNQQCDLLRGAIVVIVCFCLQQVDASKLYHMIRAQETIKLYVIFNVLEIFDKYCAWLGQDILDALFGKRHWHIFFLAVGYTLVHALVNFGQVMCLNVAINSYDHALLSMLVSNQFVELKGNVFKKFGKEQINKIACYDIVERFYQLVFLAIIAIRNLRQVDFNVFYLEREIFLFAVVFMSEIFVDWIKHAFLSKFNGFNWSLYDEISMDLSRDVMYGHANDALLTAEPRKRKFLDQSHFVTRRLGFVNLPLACLLVRILIQSIPRPHGLQGLGLVVITWLCLTATKVLVDVAVVGRAATMMQRHERKVVIEELKRAQHEFSQLYNDSKSKILSSNSVEEVVWTLGTHRNNSESSLPSLHRRHSSQLPMSSNTTPSTRAQRMSDHGEKRRPLIKFLDDSSTEMSDVSPVVSRPYVHKVSFLSESTFCDAMPDDRHAISADATLMNVTNDSSAAPSPLTTTGAKDTQNRDVNGANMSTSSSASSEPNSSYDDADLSSDEVFVDPASQIGSTQHSNTPSPSNSIVNLPRRKLSLRNDLLQLRRSSSTPIDVFNSTGANFLDGNGVPPAVLLHPLQSTPIKGSPSMSP